MSEFSRFGSSNAGWTRWGPTIGLCLKCKQPVRQRTCHEAARDLIVHNRDRGRVVLGEVRWNRTAWEVVLRQEPAPPKRDG